MNEKYLNIPVKKMIENIEPFNDCFYYSCFNSALFPVLIHYGRSVVPILANGFTCYDLNKKDGDYSVFMQYGFIRDITDVLDEQEMIVEAREIATDITADIINAIAEDRPVIISVDCFNLSNRSDYYMKGHWRHSLLLYGYDLSEGIFNIIEQDSTDDIIFKKMVIPWNDIENAYSSYFDHFHTKGELTYLSFSASPADEAAIAVDHSVISAQYRNSLKPFKHQIYSGIDGLKEFTEGFKNILLDEDALKKYCFRILNGLNDIIKSKATDLYLLSKLFGDAAAETLLTEDIIGKWNMVRTIFAKYCYSGRYKINSLENIINYLDEIIFLEEEHFKKYIFLEE